jgi:hypothetical protein
VEGGVERYGGLQEATPNARAAIRTAFEEIHKHSTGDRATGEEHAKGTTHIAVWETECEGEREVTREQCEQKWAGSMRQWNPGLGIAELGEVQREEPAGRTTGASTPQTDEGDSEAGDTDEGTAKGNEDRTAAEIAARIEVRIRARGDVGPKTGGRRNTSTAQMNKAGMIACVDDHSSEHTILVQSGMGRRTYRCGHCKRRFMQQDPGTLTCIQDRKAKWVQTRPPTLPDGGERTARNPSAARAGDQLFSFHNSSGITVAQTRKQYVRKMVPGMTIFAAVETGLH